MAAARALCALATIAGLGVSAQDMFVTVGIGPATPSGFQWSFDVTNPDLTDPVGKVYWLLTADGVTASIDDVRAGNGAVAAGCSGSADQRGDIQQQQLSCALVIGLQYRFWVVADYNGDGTAAFMASPDGITIIPRAEPTPFPTASPTPAPTPTPTPVPTPAPTPVPTVAPTPVPTVAPTPVPTAAPTPVPTAAPTPVPPTEAEVCKGLCKALGFGGKEREMCRTPCERNYDAVAAVALPSPAAQSEKKAACQTLCKALKQPSEDREDCRRDCKQDYDKVVDAAPWAALLEQGRGVEKGQDRRRSFLRPRAPEDEDASFLQQPQVGGCRGIMSMRPLDRGGFGDDGFQVLEL